MRRSLSAVLIVSLLAGCAHNAPPDDRPPQTPEEAQLDPRGGTSPWPLVGMGVGVGVVVIAIGAATAIGMSQILASG